MMRLLHILLLPALGRLAICTPVETAVAQIEKRQYSSVNGVPPLPTGLPYWPVSLTYQTDSASSCTAELQVTEAPTQVEADCSEAAGYTVWPSTSTSTISVECAGCVLNVQGDRHSCPFLTEPPANEVTTMTAARTVYGYACLRHMTLPVPTDRATADATSLIGLPFSTYSLNTGNGTRGCTATVIADPLPASFIESQCKAASTVYAMTVTSYQDISCGGCGRLVIPNTAHGCPAILAQTTVDDATTTVWEHRCRPTM